jgi:hypothetical protein
MQAKAKLRILRGLSLQENILLYFFPMTDLWEKQGETAVETDSRKLRYYTYKLKHTFRLICTEVQKLFFVLSRFLDPHK